MPEVAHDEKYTPHLQRRPNGHAATGVTKRGNKKRGLRARSSVVIEELESDEEDEEGE